MRKLSHSLVFKYKACRFDFRVTVMAYSQNQTVGTEKRSMLSALMVTAGAAGGVTGSTIFCSQDA